MKKIVYPMVLTFAGLGVGCGSSGGGSTEASDSPDYLLFLASSDEQSIEVFRTDGSEAGTYAVQNFGSDFPRLELANTDHFTQLGKRYVYNAPVDNGSGYELYIADGTEAGTEAFYDITTIGYTNANSMTAIGDKLYYGGNIESRAIVRPLATIPQTSTRRVLVISDGTEAGTTIIDSVENPNFFVADSQNNVYFTAFDTNGNAGLYVTDGTASGTRQVFNPGDTVGALPVDATITPSANALNEGDTYPSIVNGGGGKGSTWYTVYNDRLYFYGRPNNNNLLASNLFSTDASGFDVRPELETPQHWVNDFRGPLLVSNDKLYTVGNSSDGNRDIYEINGDTFQALTSGGIDADSLINSVSGLLVAEDMDITVFDTRISTPSPTQLNASGSSLSYEELDYFVEANGTVFFSADTDQDGTQLGYELWKTDGTSSGTQFVKDINPGSNDSNILPVNAFYEVMPKLSGRLKNSLVFYANDDTNGFEPWVSDGTEAGTKLLKNIAPGADSSFGR